MKIQTGIKASGFPLPNHNEKLTKSSGFVVKTAIKAGGLPVPNHNEKLVG